MRNKSSTNTSEETPNIPLRLRLKWMWLGFMSVFGYVITEEAIDRDIQRCMDEVLGK